LSSYGYTHLGNGFHTEAGCKFSASIDPNISESIENKQIKSDTLIINKIDLEKFEITINIQNLKVYPNPFSDKTIVEYSISSPSNIYLEIYDILGNKIATLVDNLYHESGIYQIDLSENFLSTGIYFCVLKTSNEITSTKLIKTNTIVRLIPKSRIFYF
jgi:hypothetical protein